MFPVNFVMLHYLLDQLHIYSTILLNRQQLFINQQLNKNLRHLERYL